jgi:hypothetical protein
LAGTRDFADFAFFEDDFIGPPLIPVAEVVALGFAIEVEFKASSIGSSRPSRARNSFKVNAVVVLGELVSFLTVSAVVAMLEEESL